ncbi:MAG: phospho-sugar mutase [Thermoleophilia bacterium]
MSAGVPAALRATAEAWMSADPDTRTRDEVAALLEAGDADGLTARFAGRLAFGTAGLRGPMRAGPTGMNRLLVRQATAGIARHLLASATDPQTRGVVVAFDARHNSAEFAHDCALVLSAHGIPVFLGAEPLPTPVGVFAIRHLGCVAGLVVTASHNPPADNGLKLYLDDAAQIVPPVDAQVAEAIDAAAADGVLVPDGPGAAVSALPREAVDAYRAHVLALVPPPASRMRIVTTAMHGVGGALLAGLLTEAGHQEVYPVAAQEDPDPEFPTVRFPNPEEPGATDLLAVRMDEVAAGLGLALDPDADRVAVMVPGRHGEIVQLSGDDVGSLLADWLLGAVTQGRPDRLVVNSVVSSSMLAAIASARGVWHTQTLTGFKWLCRPAIEHPEWEQVLAYEEALGYAIGPDTRDKDGLLAALAVASMASAAHARDRTLLEDLDDLNRRHGAHVTHNFSLRDDRPGAAQRYREMMEKLIRTPPDRIGGLRVRELHGVAVDVLRIDLEGDVRVIVRPSGTEAKLKCYCEAVEAVQDADVDGARERARHRLALVRDHLDRLLSA